MAPAKKSSLASQLATCGSAGFMVGTCVERHNCCVRHPAYRNVPATGPHCVSAGHLGMGRTTYRISLLDGIRHRGRGLSAAFKAIAALCRNGCCLHASHSAPKSPTKRLLEFRVSERVLFCDIIIHEHRRHSIVIAKCTRKARYQTGPSRATPGRWHERARDFSEDRHSCRCSASRETTPGEIVAQGNQQAAAVSLKLPTSYLVKQDIGGVPQDVRSLTVAVYERAVESAIGRGLLGRGDRDEPWTVISASVRRHVR
jgi:hypothetical protein